MCYAGAFSEYCEFQCQIGEASPSLGRTGQQEQSPGEQENQMSAFFGKCILEKTHFKTSLILTLEAQE